MNPPICGEEMGRRQLAANDHNVRYARDRAKQAIVVCNRLT